MSVLGNILTSGHRFGEHEGHLAFRFRVLNSFMLIAMVFAAIFGLLGDFGAANLGPLHPKVNYFYSVSSALLIVFLRRSREGFATASWLMVVISTLTFISALINVTEDEFRIIWFYFVIYIGYILLGQRAGKWITVAIIASILIGDSLFDLQLSQTAFYTAVLGLVIASLLTHAYTAQVDRYEGQLIKQTESAKAASRSKSMFLANMSHEIRTPMNGVLGMVQVLEGTKLDEKQRQYIDGIGRSGRSLLTLLDELLDLSRIESGRLILSSAPFDIYRSVEDLELLLRGCFDRKSLQFRIEFAEDVPQWLEGDESRLKEVITNLLGNACKYTDSGEVILALAGEYTGESDYRLSVSVQDTGTGIPDNELKKIFDPFHQVEGERIDSEGVGLGLAICYRLVAAMGGVLKAESRVGEGSRFSFEVVLPVLAPPESHDSEVRSQMASLTLLVVDDDAINRLAIRTLLEREGHHVTEVVNGREAVEYLQQQTVDAVLMDVHMPEMDGINATRALKESRDADVAAVPVIGMTASVMNDELQGYLEAGMAAVVYKPIDIISLLDSINKVISRSDELSGTAE